jgi:hypothetical protein
MFTQFAPALSQRRHWRANVMVAVPAQLPVVEVRTCPSRAVPETVGAAVLTGGPVVTAAVAALVAVPDPAELVAVSATRIAFVTSADTSRYVAAVAPVMATQEAPLELQRCHCRANVIVGVPVHVPVVEDSSCPSFAVPEITGRPVFAGGAAATTAVAALVAGVDPPEFVAVTTTRIFDPTSVAVST